MFSDFSDYSIWQADFLLPCEAVKDTQGCAWSQPCSVPAPAKHGHSTGLFSELPLEGNIWKPALKEPFAMEKKKKKRWLLQGQYR